MGEAVLGVPGLAGLNEVLTREKRPLDWRALRSGGGWWMMAAEDEADRGRASGMGERGPDTTVCATSAWRSGWPAERRGVCGQWLLHDAGCTSGGWL